MAFLLDSSTCIELMRARRGRIAESLLRAGDAPIVLSSVVVAELEFGLALSERPAANRVQLDELIERCVVAAFDRRAAGCYGPLRAALQRQGRLIGPLDLLIAAHALALDATVVTDNLSEFRRVPGLRVEQWT